MFVLGKPIYTDGCDHTLFFVFFESGDDVFKGMIAYVAVAVGVSLAYHFEKFFFTYFFSEFYLRLMLPFSTFLSICLESMELPSVLYDRNFSRHFSFY
jgi:hypothetical protein